MAEPTFEEARRLMLRLNSAGTVRRVDLLHLSLVKAYRVGHLDAERETRGEPPAESALEE